MPLQRVGKLPPKAQALLADALVADHDTACRHNSYEIVKIRLKQ